MLTQGRWARLDDITAPDPCPHAPGQPHAPPPHLPPAPPPFFAGLWTIWRSGQGAPLLAPHSPSDPLPVCHRRPTTTTYLLWVPLPANHHNLLTVGAAVGQPPRPTHCVGRRRPTTQTYFTVCRRWPTIQTYVLCAAAGSPLDRPRRPRRHRAHIISITGTRDPAAAALAWDRSTATKLHSSQSKSSPCQRPCRPQ